jgi:hypothetical protein
MGEEKYIRLGDYMSFVPQNHKITLVKHDNSKNFYDIPAHVQFPTIFITDISIPIEENDTIYYTPSNNLTEHYIVVDRGFYEAQGSFPAHYQVKVKRMV